MSEPVDLEKLEALALGHGFVAVPSEHLLALIARLREAEQDAALFDAHECDR